MTPKKATNEVKKILAALPRRKTNKEKLGDVAMIRILLETIEEPLKKQKVKEAEAAARKQSTLIAEHRTCRLGVMGLISTSLM